MEALFQQGLMWTKKILFFLETVENEMKKLEEAAVQMIRSSNPSVMPALQPLNVIQSIKYIINLMGDLCSLDLIQTVETLENSCRNFVSSNVSFENPEYPHARPGWTKKRLFGILAGFMLKIKKSIS